MTNHTIRIDMSGSPSSLHKSTSPLTTGPTFSGRQDSRAGKPKTKRPDIPNHSLRSAGSLPPFAASLVKTCLCSQIFMVAESLVSPV